MSAKEYETRPLQCWAKVKEMIINHFKEVGSGIEDGTKRFTTGCIESAQFLVAGLGDDFLYLGGEPYGGTVGADLASSERYMEAAEREGFARDLCGYMRNYWGSMFLNHYFFTGRSFPKPEFTFTMHVCDAGHAKWYQVVAEHFGIPQIVVDVPLGRPGMGRKQKQEWVIGQMNDAIEQMERITGRKYDDEKMVEAARCQFASSSLWAEICLLNKAIPATVGLKTLLALLPVFLHFKAKREGVEILKEIRAEFQNRIAEGIAAVPNERLRLMSDLTPPWHFVKLYRSFEDQGVVFVGIHIYTNFGSVEYHPDGTVTRRKTPEELGFPLNTREDVLRAYAGEHLKTGMRMRLPIGFSAQEKAEMMINLYDHWKCDGVLMHLNRGCALSTFGSAETKNLIARAGIPVGVYEGNFADFRDLDEAATLDTINTFIKILLQRKS